MKTPAGFECSYFYGDYYRGRKREECRLIGNTPPPLHWTADLCKTCPVPGIQRANACPYLVLDAKVTRGFLGINRKVVISAYCNKTYQVVSEPHVGCGQCHPLPPPFTKQRSP